MQNEPNNPSSSPDFPFGTPPQAHQDLMQGTQVVQPQNSPATPPANPATQPPPPPTVPEGNSVKTKGSGPIKIFKILIGLITVLVLIAVIYFVATKFFVKKESTNSVLTFWGLQLGASSANSIISDFEKENPTITVKYEKQDLSGYKDKLLVRSQNGNGPDIFLFYNTWQPMLKDLLAPLPQSTITNEDFVKNYYPVAQKDLVRSGAIYGLPFNSETLVLYVNKDIFNSAGVSIPATWNDFIDACRRLTVKDETGAIKTSGCALGTYDNINHAPDIMSLLLLQNGVDVGNLSDSKDRVEGALNFYTDFTINDSVWNSSMGDSISAFSEGKLAMYFGYPSDYLIISKTNPSLSLQILPVPQLSQDQVNLANYLVTGVSIKSKYQKEAMLFLKYLSKTEVMQKLFQLDAKENDQLLYPRIDMADSLKTSFLYASVLQSSSAKSSPLTDKAGDNGVNAELNISLKTAIDSINDNTSVDSVFDSFSQSATQILKKYGY